MPKKTKREKVIAEYRRKISSVQFVHPEKPTVDQHTATSSPSKPQQPHYTFTEFHKKPLTQSLALPQEEFTLIKKDLLYTLILTTLILIGQLALWKWLG